MKNICFTIQNIACKGGTERVGLLIANGLAQKGYNVHIISKEAKTPPFFYCDPRIKIGVILRTFAERRLRWCKKYQVAKYRHYLKKWSIDVVIDIDTLLDTLTIPAIEGLSVKLVSWDHYNYDYAIGNELRKAAIELLKQKSNKLVVLTQKDRQSYLKKEHMDENFVVQIYNPVPFTQQYALPHSSKTVLAVGRFQPQKGFDYLLRAWKIVEENDAEWNLVVVGDDGRDEVDLHGLSDSLGLNRVSLLPATDKVEDLYKEASIYALSSRFEGFPMVLLEACSMSLPMVAFDCKTGPSEIVENGINGFLVEDGNVERFADKLLEVIHNDVMRCSMGKQAFERSKAFSKEVILEQWQELIEQV